MRSVLLVLGIAVVAIVISLSIQKSKDLTPSPQERDDARRNAANQSQVEAPMTPDAFNPPREGMITVEMTVAGKGPITIELYPKAAPKTVAHVTGLIRKKFYDGIKVHRLEPNFVVQMGDPKTKDIPSDRLSRMTPPEQKPQHIGAGGSGQSIPFESNKLQHVVGSVAMALNSPKSSTGDSQFFINLANNHPLDGDYCVFGKVAKGMEIVQKMDQGDVIQTFVVK